MLKGVFCCINSLLEKVKINDSSHKSWDTALPHVSGLCKLKLSVSALALAILGLHLLGNRLIDSYQNLQYGTAQKNMAPSGLQKPSSNQFKQVVEAVGRSYASEAEGE